LIPGEGKELIAGEGKEFFLIPNVSRLVVREHWDVFHQGYCNLGHEAGQSPPFHPKINSVSKCTSTPLYAFTAWHLKKHRDISTFVSTHFPLAKIC
jgi:hypothetical protein